jgi:hypothetical protein
MSAGFTERREGQGRELSFQITPTLVLCPCARWSGDLRLDTRHCLCDCDVFINLAPLNIHGTGSNTAFIRAPSAQAADLTPH